MNETLRWFLSRFGEDELWMECLHCGKRCEVGTHECRADRQEAPAVCGHVNSNEEAGNRQPTMENPQHNLQGEGHHVASRLDTDQA